MFKKAYVWSTSFVPDEEDFDEICKRIIESQKLNLWGREVKFENGILYATYGLQGKRIMEWNTFGDIKIFINSYVSKQVEGITLDTDNFDLSSITKEQLRKSKQIAAYIVNDLMERYLEAQVESKRWPKQCRDVAEFIFDKDLGSIINVEGTKSNFLDLYKNAVCIIANLYKTHDTFEISNNEYNCLAYNNFLRIVRPFPFIRNEKYCSDKLGNKEIIIKVQGDDINLRETQCIFSDPYGDWSDEFKTENKKLGNEDNFELILKKRV
ncbi:MAG: hypothetical protein PHS24_04665 [Bacilli bacterium]|nr:hypothetical protein [Bacilli bacterium]